MNPLPLLLFFYVATVAFYEWALYHEKQRAVPAPTAVSAAPQESPAPAATTTLETHELTLQRSTPAEQRVSELERENERLLTRLAAFESAPVGRAQFAASLGVSETDVAWRLDRSVLFSDASKLDACVRAVGAQAAWEALLEEVRMGQRLFHFKAKNPPQPGSETVWHHYVWCPQYRTELEQIVNRFHAMGLPPDIVEAFRNTHAEGL
jgi:hypothetical protein